MNSTERRMQIYLDMQNKKSLRIKDLAEEYGVDKRTIYRDLRYLRDLNVPITHDSESGYGIMRDAHIKPLMFTNREIATILMGISFLKSQSDELILDDAKRVHNKILAAVPAELREFMSAIEKKIVVAPYQKKISKSTKGGNWFTVLSAISNNKTLEFLYTNKAGVQSSRIIDPEIISYFTDHWNVIGYCHSKKAYRNFILNRMQDVIISDKPRIKNTNSTLHELLYGRQNSSTLISILVNPEVIENLLLQIPAEIISNDKNSGKYLISFYFDDITYINKWLLAYSNDVKIISPEILVRERRDLLQNMLSSNEQQ